MHVRPLQKQVRYHRALELADQDHNQEHLEPDQQSSAFHIA